MFKYLIDGIKLLIFKYILGVNYRSWTMWAENRHRDSSSRRQSCGAREKGPILPE